MAIIQFDEKALNKGQGTQGQAPTGDIGAKLQLSGDAGVTGAGAGVGSKGTQGPAGGWTNIQDYLKVNQGENQTSDYVKNTYGSKVEQSQKELDDKTSQYEKDLKSAQDVVSGGTGAKQKIIQGINQGQGAESPWYSQIKTFLAGPQNVPGQVNVNIDQGLVDANKAQGGLLNGVYQQAGLQGPGMYALQRGLDMPNQNVQNTVKQTSEGINKLSTGAADAANRTAQQSQGLVNQWNTQAATERGDIQGLYTGAYNKLNDYVKTANDKFDAVDPTFEYEYTNNVTKIGPDGMPIYVGQSDPTKGTIKGTKDVTRANLSNIINYDPNLEGLGRQTNIAADLLGDNNLAKITQGSGIPGVKVNDPVKEWEKLRQEIMAKGGTITKDPFAKGGSKNQVKPIKDSGTK